MAENVKHILEGKVFQRKAVNIPNALEQIGLSGVNGVVAKNRWP